MTLTASTSNIFLVLQMLVNTFGHLNFLLHFMTVYKNSWGHSREGNCQGGFCGWNENLGNFLKRGMKICGR